MTWMFLIVAGVFEMIGVVMINTFHKQRSWSALLMLIAGFGLSFLFLSIAMETLPMGIAYSVWTGIGASGGAILGMVFFGEPKNTMRILFIVMILGATVGLKLVS